MRYEPWKSWNTIYITPIYINNEFTTLPKGDDLFSYTNGSPEFSVEFCVVNFQVLGRDLMDYGIRSRKSLRLGIPKASQGNIQG